MKTCLTPTAIALFLFCLAGTAQATLTPDTVRGRVVDQTGNPVAGAEVIVADIGRLATTNANGEFAIDAPRGATLIIRGAGFGSQTRTASNESLAIRLAATPFPIDPVNVTVVRAPIAGAASLSTSTLTREDLSREAGVSLGHDLDDLPGVRTLSTGEQIGKPVIRGVYGSRVLVLEDAMRLEDYSWSDEDAPSIDARFADRVEVVRGPASILYGSDALGGVVNVIPAPVPQPGSRVRRSGVELSTSSNQHESALVARTEGASGSLGWRALLIGRFAQDLKTPNGPINNTGYGAFNGELAAGTQRDWGSLTLRLAQYGGEFKLLETDAPANGGEEGGPVRKLADERAQLIGTFPIGSGRIETRTQLQRHWLEEVADLPGQAGKPGSEVPVFELLLNTFTTDVLAHHTLARKLHGTIGASFEAQRNDSRGVLPIVPDATIGNIAASAVERLETGAFQWIAGARVDHHTIDPTPTLGLATNATPSKKNAVSFNVGSVVRVAEQLTVRANAGRSWRAPNLFELYAAGPRIGEARYEIGDPQLGPERGFEMDIGANVGSQYFGADVSLYDNRIDDFIALQPTAEVRDGLRVFRHSAATARLRGIEASAEVRPSASIRMLAEYDAVRGTNEDNDEPLPWIPAPRLQAYIEVAGSALSLTHAYARLTTEHVSKKSRVAPNEPVTNSYSLIGLAAGGKTRIGAHETRVDVGVKNLANTAYRDFLNRYRDFALNPGRDITLRVSVEL